MWKVLVADDENKIRKGLINSIDWEAHDMEVVCEAEDGEIALDMIKEYSPDILLLDICMPFIGGLELIESNAELLKECKVILITGHDEFNYAQKAIKLQVFDYLLKPITKEQFLSVLIKASRELSEERSKKKYFNWANSQLEKNMTLIKNNILSTWINGHLSELEIGEQLKFLGLKLGKKPGMLVIKIVDRISKSDFAPERDRQLILCVIQNISQEILQMGEPSIIFSDIKGNIIIITNVDQIHNWTEMSTLIESKVKDTIQQPVIVSQEIITEGIKSIPQVYEKIMDEIAKKSSLTPIVLRIKKWIEANFYKEDFSLQDLADEMQISSAYLSRLLKQEIGVPFIEYLTMVRVQKAAQLLNDPTLF